MTDSPMRRSNVESASSRSRSWHRYRAVIVSSVESVLIGRSASSPSSAGVRERPRSCHHRRCSVVTSPRWIGVASEARSWQPSWDAASAREASTSGVSRPSAATSASLFDGTALTERSQIALPPHAGRLRGTPERSRPGRPGLDWRGNDRQRAWRTCPMPVTDFCIVGRGALGHLE